jgi:hypothetical protein
VKVLFQPTADDQNLATACHDALDIPRAIPTIVEVKRCVRHAIVNACSTAS